MDGSLTGGLDGLSALRSGHVCAFFRGRADHDRVVVPFIREGLQEGRKCVAICDHNVDTLQGAVADLTEEGQLEVLAPETFRDYELAPSAILDFLTEVIDKVLDQQVFRHLRLVEEISRLLDLTDVDGVLRFDAELHRRLRGLPVVLLSLYDLDSPDRRLLAGALKLHPHTVIGTKLVDNLFHDDAEKYAGRLGV